MKKQALQGRRAIKMLLIAILAGIVLWMAHWVSTHMESYQDTIDLGWSPKAKANPFLAAEQFLAQMGTTVTTARSLQSLDQLPVDGTVFISNSRQVLSERRSQALVEWMESGGHIIIAAQESDEDIPDPLLQHFEVTRSITIYEENESTQKASGEGSEMDGTGEEEDPSPRKSHRQKTLSEQLREQNRLARENNSVEQNEGEAVGGDKNTDSQDKKAKREKYEASVSAKDLTLLNFQSLEQNLTISFLPRFVLDHPFLRDEEGIYEPLYWAGSQYGVHFMQFEVGAGLLSVLSDARIWRSEQIEYFDNAHLLTVLAGRSPEVILLYGAEMPSLWQRLREYAPEWLWACCLWLAMWLFYRARRFGPVRQQTVTVRRSMAEHIYACADFLWQRRLHGQLLDTVRRDSVRRIEHRYPIFAGLPPAEQVELLRENTDLSTEEIETALFAEVPPNEAHFGRVITLLQKLPLPKQGKKK